MATHIALPQRKRLAEDEEGLERCQHAGPFSLFYSTWRAGDAS